MTWFPTVLRFSQAHPSSWRGSRKGTRDTSVSPRPSFSPFYLADARDIRLIRPFLKTFPSIAQKGHIKQVRSTERQASVRNRRLQDGAFRLLWLGGLRPGVEDGTMQQWSALGSTSGPQELFHPCGWASAGIPDGLVEDTFQVPLGQSRALEVLVSLDILGALQRLIVRYRLHPLLSETLQSLGVFSQIELSANKYDRDVWRMVVDLWEPLHRLSVCHAL